jgi:Lecithin:cholesterol acyltransferase
VRLDEQALHYLKSRQLPMYRSLQSVNQTKTPLILIPGLASSRVYAKYVHNIAPTCCYLPDMPFTPCGGAKRSTQTNWEQVWASSWGVMQNDCWRNLLNMGFSKSNGGEFTEPPGVIKTSWRHTNSDPTTGEFVSTDDFGGVVGCSDLISIMGVHPTEAWVFRNLVDFVSTTRGYTPKQSIFGAPYDFTKITNKMYMFEYFHRLKLMIEHAVRVNAGMPAVMVSHSLGGPVTNTFFNYFIPHITGSPRAASAWKHAHVRMWIPVGGPFGGAPKACRALLKGDGLGMDALCVTDCSDWYHDLEKLNSGLVWMTPDAEVFKNAHMCTMYHGGARMQTFTADIPSIINMFTAAGTPQTADAYTISTQPLAGYVKAAPGVSVHAVTCSCTVSATEGSQIYTQHRNTGVFAADHAVQCVDERDTYEYLFNTPGLATQLQLELQGGLDVAHMIGDGTVPYMSLMVPKTWQPGGSNPNTDAATGKPISVQMTHFTGGQEVEHKDILANPALLSLVADYLS